MNELSKEDQERIANAALYQVPIIGELYFRQGARYEHPIARKEGFNEAIEEVIESATIVDNLIMITREEIEKLKR